VILASLLGVWILLSTVLPAGGRAMIDHIAPIPAGADILMTQREAVNDAWDLPVADTMEPFFKRYPEWTAYTKEGDGFDWGWYYAFQQVGDQKTETLTEAYITGRMERDRLAGLLAYAAPPVLFERLLQSLAGTDVASVLGYESRVRAFHGDLRAFYYPRLFRNEPFDPTVLADLPQFSPKG
jgi:ABC-2 type transport system permease protein